MKRVWPWFAAAVLALVLVLAGYFAGRRHAPALVGNEAPASGPEAGKRKILYWYDTMVPQQHFDHPGLSPMGMEMVPKYADEDPAAGGVQIDSTTLQNLGIRTAVVERRVLATALQVPGTITWDLRQASTVSARTDGIISRLLVRAPYTRVAAGAPLAEWLAPQWSSALAEYSALQQLSSADAEDLRAAARERLQVLGLSPADIRAAGREPGAAITLRAPQAGVVVTLDVRDGQRVAAGQTLMTINGLSTVWVEAALPQAVAGLVRPGTPVTASVDALPGQAFQGRVETLLPEVDTATRTQRARIVLDNPDGRLSPGMFASVQLQPPGGAEQPVVPDDALIATGGQTRVIVAEAAGRFRAVAVRTGRAAGGYTQILDGLVGGEKVVVSGQFLIDSEASLSGALERLHAPMPPKPASSAPPQQGGHEAHP